MEFNAMTKTQSLDVSEAYTEALIAYIRAATMEPMSEGTRDKFEDDLRAAALVEVWI